ncbi:MAG TPA: hypothetical protein VD793_03715 [Gemmatimonadales bacterium]|nr:hypothetical protein [Gemmatimonadales bacterium]
MTEPRKSAVGPADRATLSRDLADFLIEFSIALHKHAMYPGGHPSLLPAAEGVVNRLGIALLERNSLSLGVARHQLVIEGVATDPRNPVLQDLAERLHRHHLGAITFRRGVSPGEVHQVLDLISVEADRSGQPLGLGPDTQLRAWPNVRLYPLTYERLHLVREGKALDDEEVDRTAERTQAARLWVGLARAALAADTVDAAGRTDARGVVEPASDPGEQAEQPPPEPSQVARAIQQHPRGTAYDQVIVGYLLQIADEVKRGAGTESVVLQRRVSQLVRDLDAGTLSRLLEMGGDGGQRRQFLLNASDALAVDAVIDLVQAAGQAEQQNISHSMLRMLQKLGQHATGGTGQRRALADATVRDQIGQLIRGWSLKDPNPGAYRTALDRMVSTRMPAMSEPGGKGQGAEPHRILQMALEVGTTGPAVSRALDQLVASDRLSVIAKTLQRAEQNDVANQIWQRVASPDVVHRILSAEPINLEQLDIVLERLGLAAAEPMLDALATSQSSQARRVLLDRLVKFGSQLAPALVGRLNDTNWFVQRNLLALLAELPERPRNFDPRPFAEHPDARVRREAIRVMLREPSQRERAIHYALADADQRTVRVGLVAAQENGCPDSAVPLVAAVAVRNPSQEFRLMAIRVLGTARSLSAADALLTIATPPRRSLISRMRAATRTPEQRAAVVSLRQFAEHPRVRQILEQIGDAG